MPPNQALAHPPEVLDDRQLALRASQGEQAAFVTIMQRHNQRLYRLARSILKDDWEAEDAVQETYLRAFTGLAGFRGESGLYTWLARIAMNEAFGRLRRRTPATEPLEDHAELGPAAMSNVLPLPGLGPLPEQAAADAETARIIERAVDRLPQPFRTVFMLRAIEQLSVEEVATLLEIPEATVKTRYHRARRLLRLALDDLVSTGLEGAFAFLGSRCDRIVARVLARLPARPV
jgi:RNA polymerase sigma-70 factor, ECF subfamily